MRKMLARLKTRWVGILVVAVLAIGSGLVVGAKLAPTSIHPPQLTTSSSTSTGAAQPGSGGEPNKLSWKQLPAASGAFLPTKIVVEKLGVQAPVEIKSVDSKNVMQTPDHPFDVAWYQFTAKPGSGSNAVFAGHKDYWGVGPAVFWHLADLRAGDAIDIVSGQSTEVRYKVTQSRSYNLTSIPMASILAPSKGDQITLITCAGAFHNGGYDSRLVVQATRS